MKKNIKFYGTDASNEISLLEYGLLVSIDPHEDNSGSHFCVYRQGEDFGTGHIYTNEIISLINGNKWASNEDIEGFLSFTGDTKESFSELSLANQLSSLIQYFGTENIIGCDYCPITEKEAIKMYL